MTTVWKERVEIMNKMYAMENGMYAIYTLKVESVGSPVWTQAEFAIREKDGSPLRKEVMETFVQNNEYVDSFQLSDTSITILIRSNSEDIVTAVVQDMTQVFLQKGYEQSCTINGSTENIGLYQWKNRYMIASELAISEFMDQAKQENQKVKIRVPLGILGALVGILLGSIAWFLVAQIGFFVGWIGYLIVFLGIKGFVLMGKRINKPWAITIGVLGILAIVATQFVVFGFEIYKVLDSHSARVTIYKVLQLIPEFLSDGEVLAEFLRNMALGVLIGGIAMISPIKSIPSEKFYEENLTCEKVA